MNRVISCSGQLNWAVTASLSFQELHILLNLAFFYRNLGISNKVILLSRCISPWLTEATETFTLANSAKLSPRRETQHDLLRSSSGSTSAPLLVIPLLWLYLCLISNELTIRKITIVTGANGFLGTALAITVMESGGDVVCLDLAPKPTAQNWGEFPRLSLFVVFMHGRKCRP